MLLSTMFFTVAAYLMWGFFPAYFPLLLPAGPLEILAHRIVWTAVLMSIVLAFTGGFRELRVLPARSWAWLVAASIAITINWGTYVLAVNSAHVADAALGYFINPLVAVALGVLFLKEQLRRPQLVAVCVAFVAVLWLTFMAGSFPWAALALALSFGIYGLLKKQIKVSAAGSVAAESLVMAPVALMYIVYLESTGSGTALSEGPVHFGLLALSGLVTALPLLCFAKGAKLLPLATIGMLQYMTPTMQMLWALFVTQEHFSPQRWIGFIIIWVAVAIYLADLVRVQAMHHHKRARRTTRQVAEFDGSD